MSEYMFEMEKRATTGDRGAVLVVVGALRRYRAAVTAVLASRYTDGTVDGYNSSVLDSAQKEIEDEGVDED